MLYLFTSSLWNRQRARWRRPQRGKARSTACCRVVCWPLAHLRKGVSRLMLCQKLDGFRLGSASTNTCCWGRLAGKDGCLWRVRYLGLPTAGQGETAGGHKVADKGARLCSCCKPSMG